MAKSVGNLAIIISGNVRPLASALNSAKSHLARFQTDNRANMFRSFQHQMRAANQVLRGGSAMADPKRLVPDQSSLNAAGLRYSSFGRFMQSSFIRGFGGGMVGGLIGVLGYGFTQQLGRIGATAGRMFAQFFSEALQEGINLTRLQISLRFLAQSGERATSWLKQMLDLSAGSGFGLRQLGQSFQTIAGQTTDLESVPAVMRAITEISAGLGADAEKMNRLALAIGQVAAAGRFEGQEILQLTETIPIKHFADTAKLSVGEFRKQMKEGTLSVNILWETLNRLALTPGGAFFGRMDEMAKSAVGQVMQLNQNVMLFKATVGQGLLEELKDQNVLSAINQGFQWLMEHQGEVRSFMRDMVSTMKNLALVTVRWAGTIVDVVNWLWRNRGIFHVLTAGGTLAIERLLRVAKSIGTGDTVIGQTGTRWAAELSAAFDRDFVPRAQEAINQIKFTPSIAPLSKEAKSLVDGISKRFSGHLGAFGEFQDSLKAIEEAKAFFRAERGLSIGRFLNFALESRRKMKESLPKPGELGDPVDFWWSEKQRGFMSWALDQAAALFFAPPKFGPQAEFATAEAFLKMESSMEKMTNEFPRAMERGSVEATSAINKAMYKSGTGSIQDRILRVLEQMKRNSDDEKKEIKTIADAMKTAPVIKAMAFDR